jgi:hypothetical protein
MKKIAAIVIAVVVAIAVLSSVLFVYYSPDYSWASSIRDHDGDGYPDAKDAFPYDAAEWTDTDKDGHGDNFDVFPSDATEWADTDADGHGDNSDAFPSDATEWQDSDRDGVGDNSDAFPHDPTETRDSDADGVGDNADWYDYGNAKVRISIDYYKEDGSADFWTYGDPFFVIKVDTNGDSVLDSTSTSGIFTDTESLSSPYWVKFDYADNQIPMPITFTIEVWESDLEGNYQMDYNPAAGGSFWTVQSSAWPFGSSWHYNGSDDGGYELDCELQFSVSVVV